MNGDLARGCAPGMYLRRPGGAHPVEPDDAAGRIGCGSEIGVADCSAPGHRGAGRRAGAARQPQRELNGTHSVLKFAPQSTRGEGRIRLVSWEVADPGSRMT